MNDILERKFTINDKVDVNLDLNYDKYTSQFALENSNIGVWDFNLETNYVNYSKEAIEVLGINNMDFNQYNWKKTVHPDDIDNLLLNLTKHYNKEAPYYISEHRILRENGTYKWIKESGRVVKRDDFGNPQRIIGTVCDITERKEKESQIAKNLKIITNQNNRLQNFAHIVTHNLKEYAGNFESLLEFYDSAESNEEKDEIITHLKAVSGSLSKTITNLNEIVSKQFATKLERESLCIHKYIESTIKLLNLEISSKKAIINNNVDPNIIIYANRSYLESIIQNLASNAIKYSHPDRTPVLNIDSHIQEDGVVTITVADNGIGIDLEKYGKDIFGLYRTFHGNDNAEGVGLYLTKNQVETLGGTIKISSKVNVGTTFTLTMNMKKNPA
ncbi:ATP-binding protein [Mariniflexile sp.]|uniref:PAS domain-containing sensor histidine kinase n=1 Tax=Mariniflexile sp. TaxID=1979402 RepID=UPI003562B044